MTIAGFQLKPHQLSPLLASPRAMALLFAGAATYIGYIDPSVRNQLDGTKNKLQHWASMYTKSIGPMSTLAMIAGIVSGICYWKTKQNLWIVGGAMMAGLWPYTYIFLMPTNKQLLHFNKTLKTQAQIASSGQNQTILKKLSSWVTGHRVRAITAILAVAVFYVAQIKSTQQVKILVNVK